MRGLGGEHVQAAVQQAMLGVDSGDVRIGVALKPVESAHAEALEVIAHDKHAFDRIEQLAQEFDAEMIVVGLPRDINGNETAQTRKAREFAGDLADATGLHIVLHDEFSTSERARERLGTMSRDEAKRRLDAEAAAVLLEDYMGSLR